MRLVCFCLTILIGFQNLKAQDDLMIPPSVKKIYYANRLITFSNVSINGQETNYLAVSPGEAVTIHTKLISSQNGDYCPGCNVQIYWGIHDYTSVCAKSFRGYLFTEDKSTHSFKAPIKEGIYYITMGGSLEISCKNNIQRPICNTGYAFAVLKVGNPDPEKKVILEEVKRDSGIFLKTTLVKSGWFGDLDKIEWFLEGEKLPYQDQVEIPRTKLGTYKVVWSNCITSASNTMDAGSEKMITKVPKAGQELPSIENSDIADLIAKNDKFILKNLIFDLNRAIVKPESKQVLNALAHFMKNKPSMKILLEGHTAIGDSKNNQRLSEQRVKAVRQYLVEKGVAQGNIQIKGWGQQKPLIVTRDIEEGKINRRVEIVVLSR